MATITIKASASTTVSIERDVTAVWRFYKLNSSSSTPSKPTEEQGKAYAKNKTVPSGWSTTEPKYDGTVTNSLYTVDLTVFSDDNVSWSDVSKSTSYEAAKEAVTKADNASVAAEEAQARANDTNANLAQFSEGKLDKSYGSGGMEWSDDALHIGYATSGNYYETEVGGTGINFKYGTTRQTAESVASITKDALLIDQTALLSAMRVGNFIWKVRPGSGDLFMQWVD